jgi:hypothetical protein
VPNSLRLSSEDYNRFTDVLSGVRQSNRLVLSLWCVGTLGACPSTLL